MYIMYNLMEQLSPPPPKKKPLVLPMNVEGIANAQATILRPPPCPKSRKLNPNVEMLFHLKASGDNVGGGG